MAASIDKPDKVFRPEIEGLRAVAATLVAVFHIWLGRVSGGVDVFFVVSSFLVTTGLLTQIERTGRVDLLLSWGRLIKRLFPAAMLVLAAVIVASLLLMPKSRWKETIEQVTAAALYMENWLLALRSVNYLARHEGVSPLQHFWALSVQGQFYLAWPLLFAAVAAFVRRKHVALRTTLLWVLAPLFAVSLAYSIYLTAHNQPFAYFNTFARTWEFCIGSLLAVLVPLLALPRVARIVGGWVGLLAILSCGAILHVSEVFPGYAALWPTLAAVLIIVSGTTHSAYGADRLLAARPLVYLGGISYGIYLWHFPILVFARLIAAPANISFATGVAVLATSVLLAAATGKFLERPTRTARMGANPRTGAFMVGAACVAPVVVGITAWSILYLSIRHHTPTHVELNDPNYPGATARNTTAAYYTAAVDRIFPGPMAVADDRESLSGPGCDQSPRATVPGDCHIHEGSADFTLAIVGGSHSSQWIPALELIAEHRNWRVITFTKSDCPFHLGDSVSDTELSSCAQWNANVERRLLDLKPSAVFMTSTRYTDGDEFVPDGYVAAWRELETADIPVVALRDNPDFEFDVSACVEMHGADSLQCALPRQRMLETPSPVALLKPTPHNVKFIDLSDYFCDTNFCRPVIGNVLVYRHMNHITATYARTLAPMLERALAAVLDGRGAPTRLAGEFRHAQR